MDAPTTVSSGPTLIRRARDGDPAAFADLFNAHKIRIYALCLRMTNNTAEAEDLTQDAFLQVFRHLASFRGESAVSTWLYRIAVNTVLMHRRKNQVCGVSFEHSMNAEGKPLHRQFVARDERLSGTVDRIMLVRALGQLPTGYRTIFLLHEVQGYEHPEIAKLLHCSEGNSKSQLHKAKVRIRQILTQSHESGGDRNCASAASETAYLSIDKAAL